MNILYRKSYQLILISREMNHGPFKHRLIPALSDSKYLSNCSFPNSVIMSYLVYLRTYNKKSLPL